MKAVSLSIPGIILIEPKVFQDNRGYIFESLNRNNVENKIGLSLIFVQDNNSKSNKDELG